MNADGGEQLALVDDGELEVGVPAWSPAGERLVFHPTSAGD